MLLSYINSIQILTATISIIFYKNYDKFAYSKLLSRSEKNDWNNSDQITNNKHNK